ncbi:MAG: ribosome-associated translation inhibitor RaiA [Telmatospirillum sp.]|nr:ribosome-associated translation inhibitor RaiA [Telmatospirillum sp.]
MQIPLQITFHGLDHSDAIEERIREKAAKLEQVCDRIIGCRVVIEVRHRNASTQHRKGEPFHIAVDVTVPGAKLVVKNDPKDSHINEDILIALREAFDNIERQLKDYMDRQRTEAKTRAAQ